jgi:hypothetical protein
MSVGVLEILRELDACDSALAWVAARPSATAEALWAECPRGDWMLWLVARAGVDRRLVVLAACDCAEPALEYVPDGEDRPRQAIEVTRAWCRGEAELEDVRAAALAAYAAYAARAADAYAALAADAYAYAARAADAYAAADCAAAYAAAADAADAATARTTSLAHSADIVRARIPWPTVAAALEAL